MANEQINIDILINASKSAKTLKEQRKALEDLKDGLDKVKYGSGAFELLNEEVENLTSSMGNLNLKFEDVYGDIQPLTGRIGELEDRMYELALAGKQNTKEFTDLQSELITMKRTVRDVDTQVDSFVERGRGITQVTQAVGGLVATFNIAQGAVALFGSENEQLEKTLVRLNAGMAVLQGLQEISNQLTERGTALNKLYNLVLRANPYVLIATAIAGVIAAMVALNDKIGDNIKSLQKQRKSIEANISKIDKEIEINKLLENSIDDLIQKRRDSLQESLELANKELKLEEEKLNKIGLAYANSFTIIQTLKQSNLGAAASVFEYIFGTSDEDVQAQVEAVNNLSLAIKDIQIELLQETEDLKTQAENEEIARQQRLIDIEKARGNSTIVLERQLLDYKMSLYKKDSEEYKDLVTEKKILDIEYQKLRKEQLEDINELIKTQVDLTNELEVDITQFGEWDELSKRLNEAISLSKENSEKATEVYQETQKGLEEALSKGLISQNQYELKSIESNQEYRNSLRKINGRYRKDIEIFYQDLYKYDRDLQIENQKFGLSVFEDGINNLRKERDEINKTSDEKLKKQGITYGEIRRIESERFNLITQNIEKEKSLIEDLSRIKLNLQEREINEEKIRIKEEISNIEQIIFKESGLRNDLEKQLTQTTDREERERLKLQIDNLDTNIKLRQGVFNILLKEEKELNIDLERIRLKSQQEEMESIKKLNEDRVKETISAWDFIKNYIKENPIETAEAFSQIFTSSLQAIDSFLTSYENRRVNFIEQETELKLKSIDAEKEAYLDSINQQTNAEKFKAAKLKEFEDKRAIEEKKRDREIAEAQYKGEIRKWEYSYVEAIVNLGKSLLAAAANPFQLAVVSALGVAQLATIQGNKPQKPQYGSGGMITGPSHNGGGVDINAEGGEVIINKKSSQAFLPLLDSINQAYGGSPLMNKKVMATGGVVTNTTIDTSNLEKIVSQMINKPIKTYVVSSDMTQQQNSDKVLKNRTSF